MSEPIKVGDFVIQVHDCCGPGGGLGVPGTVDNIYFGRTSCPQCGRSTEGTIAHLDCDGPHEGVQVSWLRKIDPLAEPEDVEHKEELPA